MTKETGIVLLLIAAAALLGGLALDRHAVARYGSAEAPKGVLWNPKDSFRNRVAGYSASCLHKIYYATLVQGR